MVIGALLVPILVLSDMAQDFPDAVVSEEIAVNALMERSREERELQLSGTGLGTYRTGEVVKGVRLTPGEIADSVARMINARILDMPDVVENSTVVSREGGGLNKMMVVSLDGCRFNLQLRVGELNKQVIFKDCAQVPHEVLEEFEKLAKRAEES